MFLPWTATDSRFFRAHGIPSYGFTPFQVLTSDALRVGGAGERIALPAYVEGVAIYRELLRRLVT
jgi:acetylornithine deacetylase/succinyl-diaminopimelate desuccinylase-like protein